LTAGKLAAVVGTRSQLEWGLRHTEKIFDLSSDGLSSIGKQDWDIGLAVRTNFRQLAYAVGDIITELVNQGKLDNVFQQFGLSYEKPSTY
jgi:polar amino acid transport system substrate-binding protein